MHSTRFTPRISLKVFQRRDEEYERQVPSQGNEKIPEDKFFNLKTVMAQVRHVIEEQKKAFTEKSILQNEKKTLEGNHERAFREAISVLYPNLHNQGNSR